MSKLRKNLHLSAVPQNLSSADSIARFLGLSLNALYLRMHFENFPEAKKINGKLYFDLNAVLDFCKTSQEEESYCWLVRDEIRSLIDTNVLSRGKIGEMLEAKNPSVAGGGVYLRPLGTQRAQLLEERAAKEGFKMEFSRNQSFAQQKKERMEQIQNIWELLVALCESGKLTAKQIGEWMGAKQPSLLGRCLLTNSPSFRVAKILQLHLLRNGLI